MIPLLAIYSFAVERKLSLSDPIKKLLPDYPNKDAAEKVTVKHLLVMTSSVVPIKFSFVLSFCCYDISESCSKRFAVRGAFWSTS